VFVLRLGTHPASGSRSFRRGNRRVREEEPEKGGIVFVGSSSIRMWPHLKRDFVGLPVINRGFGGSVSNDLVVNFDTVVGRNEPKLLVTYCGSNDINGKLSVDEAFADYTEFLTTAHDRFPAIRVILTSVKIAPRRAGEIPKVNQLNLRLESWAAENNWVRFLDCTSYLADDGNRPIPIYFREDQLHLNAAGYEKWQAILDPVLREEWAKVN